MAQTIKIARWRQTDWLWLGAVAALALIVRLVAGPRTIDDAYITFRYARNLAEGIGFVYNPGERVLGTTTPLYTCVMALSWLLGMTRLPVVALVLNSLADAATAVVLYTLARRLLESRAVALVLALLWALSPMSVTFAVGGMETSVVIFFLVSSFAAYALGHSRLAAACMALAVLTRPDALMAAALLLADMGLRPLLIRPRPPVTAWLRHLPWTEVLLFAGLLLPWILFATLYFGSPLPQSVQAKMDAYALDRFAALVRFVQHLATPFFEYMVLGTGWVAAGFPLYVALYLIGSLALMRRAGRCLPMLLYMPLYVTVFCAVNPLIFRWYLAPPQPFYFLVIMAGLWSVITGLARRLRREELSGWAIGLAGGAMLALALNAYTLRPDHGLERPAPEMAWYKLELLYEQAAEVLNTRLDPGQVVAAGDIGTLGWFTNAPILDTVGLISPQASGYYPLDPSQHVISYAIAHDLIRDSRPDYIVTLEVYVRNSLLPATWFERDYILLEKLPTDIYGSDGMLIFGRSSQSTGQAPAPPLAYHSRFRLRQVGESP